MTNLPTDSAQRALDELRDDPLLAAIQTILLSRDRERVQMLERRAEQWQGQIEAQTDALRTQNNELVNDLMALRLAIQANETRIRDVLLALELAHRQTQGAQRELSTELQTWQNEITRLLAEKQQQDEQLHDMLLKVASLSLDLHNNSAWLRDHLRPIVAELLNLQLRSTNVEVVETLRPIIAEAIRLQARDNQVGLAETLTPVMKEAAQAQTRVLWQTLAEALLLTHTPTSASVRRVRVWVMSGAVTLLAMLACVCFYARFTWALYPIAFATETPTPTLTHTPTPTALPTLTPAPAPATLTSTPQPIAGVAKGNVWMRAAPNWSMPLTVVLPLAKTVTVLSAYGEWVEVEWFSTVGVQHGWVPIIWITLSQPVPAGRITPTPVPPRR